MQDSGEFVRGWSRDKKRWWWRFNPCVLWGVHEGWVESHQLRLINVNLIFVWGINVFQRGKGGVIRW
jgi:hypothetical protein